MDEGNGKEQEKRTASSPSNQLGFATAPISVACFIFENDGDIFAYYLFLSTTARKRQVLLIKR